MLEMMQVGLYAASWIIQYCLIFVSLAFLLKLVDRRRSRWQIVLKDWRLLSVPRWWMKLWRVDRDTAALLQRRAMLAGCGVPIGAEAYLAGRRFAMSLIVLGMMLVSWLGSRGQIDALFRWNTLLLLIAVLMMLSFDLFWLQQLRKYRTDRIRKEIAAVIALLLYYKGSRLHLHGKLLKCVALTRYIRSDLTLLLNEWYQNADEALRRFKERLGTDEAYGFAEHLRAIRLGENEEMFLLLRQISDEYKAKIKLQSESRKETTSYLLFVLAGLPILYMFNVFMYPWVQEAARLFNSINP